METPQQGPATVSSGPSEATPLTKTPTLAEVLANSAPPPFTLAAFMAFLSQNHCLETLEFVVDAQRYRLAYQESYPEEKAQPASSPSQSTMPRSATPTPRPEATLAAARCCTSWLHHGDSFAATDHICALWQKLMHAYIVPNGPREVNLPSPVRDQLLKLAAYPSPPNPSTLDDAVRIIYELMNDSVMGPFLESVLSVQAHQEDEVDPEGGGQDPKRTKSRMRRSRDALASRTSGAGSSSHQNQHHNHNHLWADESHHSQTQDPARGDGDEHKRASRAMNYIFTQFPSIRNSTSSRTEHHHHHHHPPSSVPANTTPTDANLADDSGSIRSSASSHEPMTPPTTPPTLSDPAFASSPVQRALLAHNNGWKRVSARLRLGKGGRFHNKQSTSSTSSSVGDPAEDDDLVVTSAPAGQ